MIRTVRLQAREDNLRKMSILFQLDLLDWINSFIVPRLFRDDLNDVLRVVINVTDSELVAPVIRDDLMTLDSESVWLTFTNDDKNEVRIGVNPAGDAIVQFVHDGDEWLDSDVDITNEMTVNCHFPSIDQRPSDYW